MTLDQLDENEDDFSEEDEAAIEIYRFQSITKMVPTGIGSHMARGHS